MFAGEDDLGEPDIQLTGLSIWAFSYAFPEDDSHWSANWLNMRARVLAEGACVENMGPTILRVDDLARFRNQLAAVYRDLKGTAKLECIEHDLVATVTPGSRGDIEVVVEITPDHLTQSHRFVFATDQTYLAEAVAGLQGVLERLPIRATRGS